MSTTPGKTADLKARSALPLLPTSRRSWDFHVRILRRRAGRPATVSLCDRESPVLVAVPPGVATPILPVFAPVGTVLVICVSESTVKLVALTPPKLTLLAPVKLSPVITTLVPTGPLVGEKLEIVGVTRNFTLLVKVRLGVVTFTLPVVAPLGTV